MYVALFGLAIGALAAMAHLPGCSSCCRRCSARHILALSLLLAVGGGGGRRLFLQLVPDELEQVELPFRGSQGQWPVPEQQDVCE